MRPAAHLPVGADRRAVFQGAPEHLVAARAATRLPALRKDFMYEGYQVAEARAWAPTASSSSWRASMTPPRIRWRTPLFGYGMDVLVEVHDEAELLRALKLRSRLLGINNRNLKTFETTLATAERLAPLAPRDRVLVGESGISTPGDVARLAQVRINTLLVGESLMRQPDVEFATRALLATRRADAAAE